MERGHRGRGYIGDRILFESRLYFNSSSSSSSLFFLLLLKGSGEGGGGGAHAHSHSHAHAHAHARMKRRSAALDGGGCSSPSPSPSPSSSLPSSSSSSSWVDAHARSLKRVCKRAASNGFLRRFLSSLTISSSPSPSSCPSSSPPSPSSPPSSCMPLFSFSSSLSSSSFSSSSSASVPSTSPWSGRGFEPQRPYLRLSTSAAAAASGHSCRSSNLAEDPCLQKKKQKRCRDETPVVTTEEEEGACSLQPDIDNTVALKIAILGDNDTGKTSFMMKYASVGTIFEGCVDAQQQVLSMEKKFKIHNTTICFSIWDIGGQHQLPVVCCDAAAILIMFDLTRRSTLHSVKDWFLKARECNQTALSVIIGTKYDHFIQMPYDIQAAIIKQARLYAQAMGASLFFSSVTHDINVQKVFKVIVAKLFDLPCNIAQNHNFGEPLVDY